MSLRLKVDCEIRHVADAMRYVTFEIISDGSAQSEAHERFGLADGRAASEPAFSAASSTRVDGPVHEIPRAFPEMTYELLGCPTINAQAWRLGSVAFVRVYGGLVRHPAITKYGLALMLAHETGHHLGAHHAIPRCRADLARSSRLLGRECRNAEHLGTSCTGATLRAAREIVELHRMMESQFEDDEPDLSPDCRYRFCAQEHSAKVCQVARSEAFVFISHDSRLSEE